MPGIPAVITSVGGVPMAIPAGSLGVGSPASLAAVGSPLPAATTAVATSLTAFMGAGMLY